MKKNIAYALISTLLFSASSLTFAAKTYEASCTNGERFEIAFPDTDHAMIHYNGELMLLKIAISASGSRYIGDGWQWWSKGREGELAALIGNETQASEEGISCTVSTQSTIKSESKKQTRSNPKGEFVYE